ncbi:MAG TPA: acetyl-CoA carboxylase carboxyl transferase subunit beta, partial [Phaeodactylibacter sp.]|nr:acetyl-CoA carboxylase carboxyl transferase subunit beta [Phaeodactylibacter sp.]
MGWFKRLKDGIITATKDKKEAPDGLWYKCEKCKEASILKEVKEAFHKCPKCNYHIRIGSHDYFDLIFDGKYTEIISDLLSKDFLQFSDLKKYSERLEAAKAKTELDDAMTVAVG